MHNASTTKYDYGCNTEIYGLIRIATDDAESYPWLILRQIRECVTWILNSQSKIDKTKVLMKKSSLMKVESIAECWSIRQYF